jgi:N-acetylneuraminate synthase/N,N'-diacetyllegionaminate synthase
MKTITIGKKKIGENEPIFIIAEAGSNHNRKITQAKKLIEIAADAGADAVKFQIFKAEQHYSKKTPKFSYLKSEKSTFNIIKENELPREWIQELSEHSKENNIIFLATPSDREAIDILETINVPAYKWASFEIVDLPLLQYVSSKGKPIFLSTGLSKLGEIEEAIDTIISTGNKNIVLLHCVSLYPSEVKLVNLRAMDTLRQAFNTPVGFSDHTLGLTIPIAAAARGASVIEKHFTISRKLKGPDHRFSLEPKELKEMIKSIRDVELSLGSPIKKTQYEEKEMEKLARRSIIARVDILRGTKITKEMLTIKRPGYGIKPKFIDIVVGREAKKDIMEDECITWEMV